MWEQNPKGGREKGKSDRKKEEGKILGKFKLKV
jgi:hypothetical protein